MNQVARLHRDDAMHRDDDDVARVHAPDSAEDVLAKGHIWLRFPKPLEQAFEADTLEPRRRLLMGCALLGCLGVILGSGSVNEATPEIAALVWEIVWVWMTVSLLLLVAIGACPARWRRGWHGEMLTALMGTAMGLLVTWMGTASQTDTAITHSAMASIPVMYACIAARLRFYWSLASALISFVAYACMVQGHTPEQAHIAAGIRQLMAVSYVFALVTNYAFEYRERRNWLWHRVAARQRASLKKTFAQLRQLSMLDPLTGLHNRRQFDQDLQDAMARAGQHQQPLALLAIDIDDFKRYNDTYGHPVGDTCLSEVARILATVAKAHGGVAARLGGEEFAIILPDHAPDMARLAGETTCQAVAAVRMPHQGSSVSDHVTVSVGMAAWLPPHESATSLQARADQALYQAKAAGRNRLAVAEAPVAPMADASPPAAAGAPTDEATAPPSRAQEALCQATLDSHFLTLRFPASLESAYIAEHAPARRRLLAIMTLVGLLIYNGLAINNRAIFSDIHESVLDIQVWLSLGVILLGTLGYFTPWPSWREGVYSLTTAMVALVSTWMCAQSQLTSALSYAVSIMLIPMFSGVAARQPFWFTCVPSVITSLAAALMLKPIGPTQAIVYADNLFMILNNMAYTLILAYALEHGTRKEWLLRRIDDLQRNTLLEANRRLKALSAIDPLTGICNRRQFEDDLDRIWREHLQEQRPVGMLILDVDHFKRYNDKQGHLAGDECLRTVAALISRTAQPSRGLTARMGGEEFGVLLPGGDLNASLQLAERIRAAVSQACLPHDDAPSRHVTLSIGVASIVPQAGVDRISLFATADKALYEAKRAGRNRVMGPMGAPEVRVS